MCRKRDNDDTIYLRCCTSSGKQPTTGEVEMKSSLCRGISISPGLSVTVAGAISVVGTGQFTAFLPQHTGSYFVTSFLGRCCNSTMFDEQALHLHRQYPTRTQSVSDHSMNRSQTIFHTEHTNVNTTKWTDLFFFSTRGLRSRPCLVALGAAIQFTSIESSKVRQISS